MAQVKGPVVVIGGGHNGLATAALLGRAGVKAIVLEARPMLGGAAVTEEFHRGFKASTVAHTLGPLRASLVEALDLTNRGLGFIQPEPRLFAPLRDGGGLLLWGDAGKTAFELRKLSGRDADRYPEFHRALTAVCDLMARAIAMTPPDIDRPVSGELWAQAGAALAFRNLGKEDAYRLLRWGPMAVADFASEWFETEILRAVLCARGITGTFAGPWSAGTTANLLWQAAASGGNGAGSAVQLTGGLGSLIGALTAAARQHGAEIRTGAEVDRIAVKDGRVTGVVLKGGEEITATAVASSADPHRTFLRMLDPAHLDPDDLRRIRNYRITGMASKVNFALDGSPAFRGANPEMLRGRIHIGATVDDLERAFDDAKYGAFSRRPYLDLVIPTLSDATLAPAGKHVLSAYVQYTPYALKTGGWPAQREALGDVVMKTIEEYAPGFASLVLHRQVLTPLDLEETYGLTRGHPMHGEPSLDQLFLARPLLGWARYRAPITGLYLCGAGAHPGGGVTGGPAFNAAREILKDL